jgi:alpha-D-ribose 1-methylphosphonate 5-triphosphate synthase subunit PhnI
MVTIMALIKNRRVEGGEEFWNHVEKVAAEQRVGSATEVRMSEVADYKEQLGLAIDRVDNLAHALLLQMRPELHVQALRESLPEVVKELQQAYVGLTGENPWE